MLDFRVAGDLGIGCAQIAHRKFGNIIISGELGSPFWVLSRDALRVTRNPSLPVRNILWDACRTDTLEGVRSLRR